MGFNSLITHCATAVALYVVTTPGSPSPNYRPPLPAIGYYEHCVGTLAPVLSLWPEDPVAGDSPLRRPNLRFASAFRRPDFEAQRVKNHQDACDNVLLCLRDVSKSWREPCDDPAAAAATIPNLGPQRSGCSASAPVAIAVTITWVMAERFGRGYDRNRNGLPDLPNSYEYVNPGAYEVQFVACAKAIGVAAADISCVWTINNRDGSFVLRATGPTPMVRLPQGTYSVTVTVRLADGRTGSARETIRVKDILIIALGDSLATGEGNPEKAARWAGLTNFGLLGLYSLSGLGSIVLRRAGIHERKRWVVWARRAVVMLLAGALFECFVGVGWAVRGRLDPAVPACWADGGPRGDQPRVTPAGILPPANVLHARAHRSTRSGPAQFAMRLEAEDPHTSVTFVCLAATGARTDDLFRPDLSDQNRALGPGPTLPSQLDELHAIVGSRPADILVLALGMNDSHTFELLGELLRREVRCIDPLRLLASYPTRKDWAATRCADVEALVDRKELPTFKRLSPDARRELFIQDVDLIYDVAESAKLGLVAPREQLDRLAGVIAKDPLLAGAEVYLLEYPDPTRDANGATGVAMLDDLVPSLRVNRRELDMVRENLVRPVNRTLREAADRQGWSYVGGIFSSFRNHGYTAKDTWFRRAKESEQHQGPRLWLLGYIRGELAPGALHPNHCGHQSIAERLYRSLAARRTSYLSEVCQ